MPLEYAFLIFVDTFYIHLIIVLNKVCKVTCFILSLIFPFYFSSPSNVFFLKTDPSNLNNLFHSKRTSTCQKVMTNWKRRLITIAKHKSNTNHYWDVQKNEQSLPVNYLQSLGQVVARFDSPTLEWFILLFLLICFILVKKNHHRLLSARILIMWLVWSERSEAISFFVLSIPQATHSHRWFNKNQSFKHSFMQSVKSEYPNPVWCSAKF